MLDDSVLLASAILTLRLKRMQERGARILKLVSGVVIMLLGTALTVRTQWPEWGRFGL